ncbi:RmlC-like cupins superfamily protein [Striga asiatica]|uniref:Germin-like protein n=1 Tax=Striga asiatica TaxID=4170 RepID=A0A5A7R080_STRAF|nr:RmlC-like cupins superfamily protein [Striga asiatica]
MSTTKSMLLVIVVLAVLSLDANAYDAAPLQDFCVGVNDSEASVLVNGKICKDPNTVTSNDFFFSGLNKAGNITSHFGTKVTALFVNQFPALNTLGISMVRIDFAPEGANPPHVHPHASEILLVLEGTLYAGFISSNPPNAADENKLYSKVLNPGDVFLFPKGLIHFQYNLGSTNAVAIAALSSQNPGVVTLSKAVFGSEPSVLPDLLTRSYQLDGKTINRLLSLEWIGTA